MQFLAGSIIMARKPTGVVPPADGRSACRYSGDTMRSFHVSIPGLVLALVLPVWAQPDNAKKPPMSTRASGTFEVKVAPLSPYNADAGAQVGRMSLDKQFHGDLEGDSKGEMLTAGNAAKGSAGYVAIERVSGKLHGRSGSFILQHSGSMHRGTLSLTLTVVPDSGTGELAGLSGKMNIIIADGKHSYEFDYTLDPSP